jgi:hypothetical protein
MPSSAKSPLFYVLLIALATATSCACPTAPSVSSISPSSTTAGGGSFTLTVNGSHFQTTSLVYVNGTSMPTTYASGQQLTATIPASDIVQPGTLQVIVLTPPSGGTTSTGTDQLQIKSATCAGGDSNVVPFTVSQ